MAAWGSHNHISLAPMINGFDASSHLHQSLVFLNTPILQQPEQI
jgi:hypothetical protein